MLASVLLHGLWEPNHEHRIHGSHKPCKSTDASIPRPKCSFPTQRTSCSFYFLHNLPRLNRSSLHLLGLSNPNIWAFSCVFVLFLESLVSTKEATFCSSAGATKAPLVAQAPAPCLLTEGCCLHFTRYCIFCPREVLIQKILHIFLKCNVQLSNFHNLLVFSIQFLWDRVLTLSTRWWTASLCFSSNSILNILLCTDIMTWSSSFFFHHFSVVWWRIC